MYVQYGVILLVLIKYLMLIVFLRYTMTKSSTIIFILIFALLFKLEEKVPFCITNIELLIDKLFSVCMKSGSH